MFINFVAFLTKITYNPDLVHFIMYFLLNFIYWYENLLFDFSFILSFISDLRSDHKFSFVIIASIFLFISFCILFGDQIADQNLYLF